MSDAFDSSETVMKCLKQMESALLGLKQARQIIPKGPAIELLDSLIQDAEARIAEVKRALIQ